MEYELESNIITPTNYDDPANIPEDLHKMAQSIQFELNKKQQDIENLLEELPNNISEGTNLHIRDSAKARASIFVKGNTEKETVSDNLFDTETMYSIDYPSPIKVVEGSYFIKKENEHKNETQTYILDFPQGMKFSKEDELEFNYNEKNGYKTIDRDSVYHVLNSNEYEFTGNENIVKATTSGGYDYFYIDNIINDYKYIDDNTINHISNYFKSISVNQRYVYGSLFINLNKRIAITDNNFATSQDFKNWLIEKKSQGIPLKLYYQSEISTKTQITDETFINQLEHLLNSETYKGVTNIITEKGSTEVADLIVKVDYKQSNNLRIDALEKAILSLGGNI